MKRHVRLVSRKNAI